MRGEQRRRDHSQGVIDPKQYIIVPQPNYAIPMLLETTCTCVVAGLLVEMLTAVKFDDQLGPQTDEVRIETVDPVLAAEFAAEQAAIAKMLPEFAFGLGLQAAQAAFARVGLWATHSVAPGMCRASWRLWVCLNIRIV
jgi:hypothetical protein